MATAATGQGATMSTAAPTTRAATKATMPRSTPRTGNGETASMRVASTMSVVATTTSVIRVAMAAPSNDRAGMSHRFNPTLMTSPTSATAGYRRWRLVAINVVNARALKKWANSPATTSLVALVAIV